MSSRPRPDFRKNELTVLLERGSAVHEREDRLRFQTRSDLGVGKAFLDEMAAVFACCGAFEWVALSYLAISSVLIGIFAQNLSHPVRLLSVQALLALVIVALCRAEDNVWTQTSISPANRHGARRGRSGTLTQRFW